VFNFDEIPRVVGGPYEYGVPGARHAIMHGDEGAEVTEPKPAVVGAATGGGGK
jgi:cytochrome c oxidase subunit 1